MIKTIKISVNALLGFVDHNRLCDFCREDKTIRKAINKISKETDGNYHDGLVGIKILNNDVYIDFEINKE